MRRSPGIVVFASAFFTLCSFSSAHAQTNAEQILWSPNPVPSGYFGRSVRVSDNRIFVGSPLEGTTGAGAVLVHQRIEWRYLLVQTLTASLPQSGSQFGCSLAIDGNRLAVGAKTGDAGIGAVHVFEFDGKTWIETAKIPGVQQGSKFGHSVALVGDRLLIGAPDSSLGGHTGTGAAYLFEHDSSGWTLSHTFSSPKPKNLEFYGYSLDLSLEHAAIGSVFSGKAVHVYVDQSGTWPLQQTLKGVDNFEAYSVDLQDHTLIVGTPEALSGLGQVSVFEFDGAKWNEAQLLTGSDPTIANHFGRSVSISGNTLLVGADQFESPIYYGPGKAYQLEKVQGSWQEQEAYAPTDLTGDEAIIGSCVSVEDGVLGISAVTATDTVEDQGAVLVEFLAPVRLLAHPIYVLPGVRLTFDSSFGWAGNPALLTAVEVNGINLFIPITSGFFDVGHEWSFSVTIPPGLSGLVIEFITFGINAHGKVEPSNRAVVTFF